MRILVVNPNTSLSMTERLRRELELSKLPGTELTVTNPAEGPRTIEDEADEAAAIPPMLVVIRNHGPRHDAVVIACFSDPGLEAARAVVSVPVVGLMEASVHLAALLGPRFTILTSGAARVAAKVGHVARLGLPSRLASVRPLDMSVLEMDLEPERAARRIAEVGRTAVRDDGANVLILGCAGLSGHAARVGPALGVPVIDPGTAALATAEVLVRLRLRTVAGGRTPSGVPAIVERYQEAT